MTEKTAAEETKNKSLADAIDETIEGPEDRIEQLSKILHIEQDHSSAQEE